MTEEEASEDIIIIISALSSSGTMKEGLVSPTKATMYITIDREDTGQGLMSIGETIKVTDYSYCQNHDFMITDMLTVGDKPRFMLVRATEILSNDNTTDKLNSSSTSIP